MEETVDKHIQAEGSGRGEAQGAGALRIDRVGAGLPARLRVDRDHELPLGTQLAWVLRGTIATGRIAPGDQLPSVRDLAESADVNVNTARTVYNRLEAEGFIDSHQGRGTFVAQKLPAGAEIERIAARATREAEARGVDPRDLAVAIFAGPARIATPEVPPELPPRSTSTPLLPLEPQRDERSTRDELRRQIAKLEAELAGHTGRNARETESPHPALRPRGRIADTDELERTRDRLVRRLAEVRVAEREKGRSQEAYRGRIEEMVRAPERHRWEWVSSGDVGDDGCKNWEVRPRYGVIGMVMGWWRVKVSSGCPLAEPRRRRTTTGERDRVRTRCEDQRGRSADRWSDL